MCSPRSHGSITWELSRNAESCPRPLNQKRHFNKISSPVLEEDLFPESKGQSVQHVILTSVVRLWDPEKKESKSNASILPTNSPSHGPITALLPALLLDIKTWHAFGYNHSSFDKPCVFPKNLQLDIPCSQLTFLTVLLLPNFSVYFSPWVYSLDKLDKHHVIFLIRFPGFNLFTLSPNCNCPFHEAPS